MLYTVQFLLVQQKTVDVANCEDMLALLSAKKGVAGYFFICRGTTILSSELETAYAYNVNQSFASYNTAVSKKQLKPLPSPYLL